MECMSQNTPVGRVTMTSEDGFLTGIWIAGQRETSEEWEKKAADAPASPVLFQASGWLIRYFVGMKPDPAELPLAPAGNNFSALVRQCMLAIPYGKTVTYGEIARKIAFLCSIPQMSAQAVGGAVGHNPFSIVVPCHRVVGAEGNLTGYAGGLLLKMQLLQHEGVDLSEYSLPKNSGISAQTAEEFGLFK